MALRQLCYPTAQEISLSVSSPAARFPWCPYLVALEGEGRGPGRRLSPTGEDAVVVLDGAREAGRDGHCAEGTRWCGVHSKVSPPPAQQRVVVIESARILPGAAHDRLPGPARR